MNKDYSKKDYDKRDQIIFGEKYHPKKYIGGYRSFERMNAKTLRELVNEDFADARMKFDDAPTIQSFLEYGEKHKNVTYNGYAISPERQNFRIIIDEINQDFDNGSDIDAIIDFVNKFHGADELFLTTEHGQARWD